MAKMSFAEQIKHPNWQRKRLEIMELADFQCENCGAKDVTLNVHHKQYVKGRMYWEYESHELECLCEDCHKDHHQTHEALKALLAEVDVAEAFAVVCGWHHHSDWIDPANRYQGRDGNPLAYAAGFVAWMVYNLSGIDAMDKVGAYAASLMRENQEARMVYEECGHIFGRGD